MATTIKEAYEKYLWVGIVVVAIAVLVLIYFLANSLVESSKAKGQLSVNLEDNSIKSNDTTNLLVTARNTGKTPLEGEFTVSADDSEAVIVTYEETDLLKFRLLEDESITRNIDIQGFSKAIRTDYKIDVQIKGTNESIIDTKTVILTVKKPN